MGARYSAFKIYTWVNSYGDLTGGEGYEIDELRR